MNHRDENINSTESNGELRGVHTDGNGSPANMTKVILRYIEEGAFFLDSQFNFGESFSAALEEILCVKELKGTNFLSLLENRVPEDIITNTREFLEIMFRPDLEEEEIYELNPLAETEFFYEDEWGMWTSSKTLSFRFKRVVEGGKIVALFSTVRDLSEERRLNQKLKQIEDHTQKQMEWLVNILHVEPDLLRDFFVGVEHEMENVDNVLKNTRETKKYFEVLENIYRSLYIIKGNASLLDLKFFSDKASHFLEKIVKIKDESEIDGNDFVPIVIELGELRSTLEEIKTIFQRISQFHNHFRAKRSYESELLVNSLKNLTQSLSRQLKKPVSFDYKDFDALSIPYTYRQMVRDVLFLLIRNALLYGIETREERRSANKSNIATIKIITFTDERFLGLVLRHDGRIERIERLLQKMITADYESEEERRNWEGISVSQLLFMPNMSVGDEQEILANSAMDIEILKRKLKEKGGRLKITFTSEEFCEFIVFLPLRA
ncbi:MAG: hypothetical protein P8184_02295 [Calditrichia bacterium]